MIAKQFSLILLVFTIFSINLFATSDDVDILLGKLIEDNEGIKKIIEEKIKFCNDVKHKGAYSDNVTQLKFLADKLEAEVNKIRNPKSDGIALLKSMWLLDIAHKTVLLQYQQVSRRITEKKAVLMIKHKEES